MAEPTAAHFLAAVERQRNSAMNDAANAQAAIAALTEENEALREELRLLRESSAESA